jgi:hypothetical protein
VLPLIAEVEDEAELVAGTDLGGHGHRVLILDDGVVGGIRESDPPPAGELELVEMRYVPPRERGVDGICQRRKRVRRTHDEDPSRRRPQLLAERSEQVDPKL